MAQSFGKDIKNNFTRGVVSEFSGLNFPEDAATDASNVVFDTATGVSRRLGFDYEENHESVGVTLTKDTYVVQEYIWENVNGDGSTSFLVLQAGGYLYFYQITDTGALSANRKSYSINLAAISGFSYAGTLPCQFTQGGGQLFVVHPRISPFRVKYTPTANGAGSWTFNWITLKIRDLEGLDDGLPINKRPVKNNKKNEMVGEHRYNLWNQGWYGNIRVQGESGSISALKAWRLKRDDFPSNSDVWWTSRNANGKFDHDLVDRILKGTHAPKGYFILNAFEQDRNSVAELEKTLPKVTSGKQYPSTVAFYAGRVFYAGVSHLLFHDKIYYSQVIIDEKNYDKCYQKADPTDENTVGLLPTDGGAISLSDVGKIHKLLPVQNYLVIFASNGIWTISGGESPDFKATDYTIRKISDIQSLSHHSFVIVKSGLPIWWNADGIYTLNLVRADGGGQTLEVVSLTDTTIRSKYRDIPATAKRFAKGSYNPLENTIQWVYSTDPLNPTVSAAYWYDSILLLNLDTNAFTFWNFPKSLTSPIIAGILCAKGSGVEASDTQIETGDFGLVTDASGDPVTVLEGVVTPLTSTFKYTTIRRTTGSNYNLTFSNIGNLDYVDWATNVSGGVDYDSYFITGYEIRGDAQRRFQSNQIFIYSTARENSSCYMQGLWDYSIDDSSGKETSAHQVYIDRSFVGVQRRKVRLRGRGYSLQLKFFSEPGKGFNILGWSSFQSANNLP